MVKQTNRTNKREQNNTKNAVRTNVRTKGKLVGTIVSVCAIIRLTLRSDVRLINGHQSRTKADLYIALARGPNNDVDENQHQFNGLDSVCDVQALFSGPLLCDQSDQSRVHRAARNDPASSDRLLSVPLGPEAD